MALTKKNPYTAQAGHLLPASAHLYRHAVEAMESLAVIGSCHRGEEIYSQEDPTEDWYRIVSGMARKSALLIDGRRTIVDFLMPGDFFGFSARETRAFDVEAVTEGTIVARYPRRIVESLAHDDPELSRELREMAFDSISRLQARVLILARPTAVHKVCAFLIEMANRAGQQRTELIVLPMSRYDIADYLAVSVETVSRALTRLRRLGVIRLADKHRVTIVNAQILEAGNGRQLRC